MSTVNTQTEITEGALRPEGLRRASALAAAEALKNESMADRDKPLREDTGAGWCIYERRVPGFHLYWDIEPEGTPGRSVMYVDWRNGQPDDRFVPWTEGETSGYALPWTAEHEAVIRAAGEYWDRL